MCGIAGFVNCDVTREEIAEVLLKLQKRGTDATGLAFKEDGGWYVVKGAINANNFVKLYGDVIERAAKSQNVILHCRLATNGTPHENANNHPIVGSKYAIVHNGVVDVENEYKAKGETDTEQLLLDIEHRGLKALNEVCGSFAIALWNNNTVWLARNHNPIRLYRRGKGFVFCSLSLEGYGQRIKFKPNRLVKLVDPLKFKEVKPNGFKPLSQRTQTFFYGAYGSSFRVPYYGQGGEVWI